ncbi:Rep family protein, partial [Enterococcus viikkiensis]
KGNRSHNTAAFTTPYNFCQKKCCHSKNADGTVKEPHVHMMLEFQKSVRLTTIARNLNDQENYLQIFSRRGTNADAQNGYAYLIHFTANAKNKYQYNINEVRANFDFDAYISNLEFGISKKDILNKLRDNQITAIDAKKLIADSFGADVLAIYSKKIETIDNYRSENEYQAWKFEMREQKKAKKIIWLYGKSGTGKSLIAEKLSSSNELPYFKTGGSNDLFQGYNGEHLLILDELRPEHISFNDLLKIIDPYNFDSTTLARYKNAKLQAEIIVVTSPYSPQEFYINYGLKINTEIDKFKQLDRRISLTIEVTENNLIEKKFNEDTGMYEILSKISNSYKPEYVPDKLRIGEIFN